MDKLNSKKNILKMHLRRKKFGRIDSWSKLSEHDPFQMFASYVSEIVFVVKSRRNNWKQTFCRKLELSFFKTKTFTQCQEPILWKNLGLKKYLITLTFLGGALILQLKLNYCIVMLYIEVVYHQGVQEKNVDFFTTRFLILDWLLEHNILLRLQR